MAWYTWVLVFAVVSIVSLAGIWWLTNRLRHREPYGSVLALRTREKIRFFRLIVTDKRVPVLVKAIPFLVALYLATPIDLIPDFLPVLGYLDDIGIVVGALALVVKLTPPDLIYVLIDQAKSKPDGG